MEYQKVTNLLDNTPNQQSKFKTKNWVKTYDDSGGTCNTNSQIEFKNSLRKSSSNMSNCRCEAIPNRAQANLIFSFPCAIF